MPLNDAGYTIPTSGRVYLAPPGTADPGVNALQSPPAPWAELGHVGTEENDGAPEIQYDGGDKTTKGSWAKKNVRTITAAITDFITMSLSQIDRTTLGLYFGGSGGNTPGEFAGNTTDPTSTRVALLIVWQDGDAYFGAWWANTEAGREDSIELTDNENPAMLPVRFTVLDPVAGTLKFKFLSSTIGS